MVNGLTKIPLYSAKHLKKCRHEISGIVGHAAVRDVDDPDEPNKNIEDLSITCQLHMKTVSESISTIAT